MPGKSVRLLGKRLWLQPTTARTSGISVLAITKQRLIIPVIGLVWRQSMTGRKTNALPSRHYVQTRDRHHALGRCMETPGESRYETA